MDPILQFFDYSHLPQNLQAVAKPFHDTVQELMMVMPRNPERTVCLRKLLEARDCAMRSVLYRDY